MTCDHGKGWLVKTGWSFPERGVLYCGTCEKTSQVPKSWALRGSVRIGEVDKDTGNIFAGLSGSFSNFTNASFHTHTHIQNYEWEFKSLSQCKPWDWKAAQKRQEIEMIAEERIAREYETKLLDKFLN